MLLRILAQIHSVVSSHDDDHTVERIIRNRLAVFFEDFKIKFNRLTNISDCFFECLPLAVTARQARTTGYKPARFVGLNDHLPI